MHFNPYGGVAAQIAVDLVNTPPEASAEYVAEILRRRDYKPMDSFGAKESTALKAWSKRLRPVFDASRDDQVQLLNALLAESIATPYISQHDGREPHLHYSDERSGVVRRIRAYTAAGLAHAVCEDAGRIGACDRDGCDVVYVDTSRNGRRRFCSTRCSTRVHVAAHRSRAVRA